MGDMASTNKLKVEVSQLRKGMYVCELDRPWLETTFLTQGFPLLEDADLRAVQKQCEYVYVDVARSQRTSLSKTDAQIPNAPAQNIPVTTTIHHNGAGPATAKEKRPGMFKRLVARRSGGPMQKELTRPVQQAQAVVEETSNLVRTVFDDVRLGNSINTPQAKEVVSRCVDQVIENPDAMMLLTSIKDKDNYTAEHSLNVAILAIVLGRQIGMQRKELEELGTCGLLHDVGKILTPDEVLKKPGHLSAEEFLIMKMHPGQGRDILMGSDGVLGKAIDVAHGHHERLDGSGYPRGLTEDRVSHYTRLVAVVDTYDAITSDRVYASGRSNIEAYKILQSQGGNHYDSGLVSNLIAAIGVYPPGSVVQLNNGEIGVVVRNNPARKLQPKLLILKNAKRMPVPPRYVDLTAPIKKDSGLRITGSLNAKEVGVDIQAFRTPEFLRQVAS